MYKVTIFVHCSGWKSGGYENTIYLQNKKDVINYTLEFPYCDILDCYKVSVEEFSNDYIGQM